MRIVAGKFRSQTLTAPKGWKTRPTSDRLRETLFNVLAPRIQGAIFADLFAGTGAVGIEALSRGARQVYFAENAKGPLAALRGNLEKLGIGSEGRVEPGGTQLLLRNLLAERVNLDIVFLDPPYDDQLAYDTALRFIAEHPILSPGGLVVAEHSRRSLLVEPSGRLQPFRQIVQGEAALTFFHCNKSE